MLMADNLRTNALGPAPLAPTQVNPCCHTASHLPNLGAHPKRLPPCCPQDKECDRKVGVKSSALALGELNGAALIGFALASTALLVATGVAAGSGPAYYVGIAGVALHFTWQLAGLDLNDPGACGDRFRSNTWVGLLVFLGVAVDRLLLAT